MTSDPRFCPQCATACPVEHSYCPTCGFPVGSLGKTEDRFVGRTLPGGYHVLDLLGVGGMGRVYRAEQAALGRTVAVKVIHPHLLTDDNAAMRFMTEARAASQLNHPNSLAVYDFGRTEQGEPYIVMEYLRGQDLGRVAFEQGPLPLPRIAAVLKQVLAALGEAHELGIIHRDLKPENVVLEPIRRGGDHVKVVDFGLAKLRDEGSSSVTSPGIVCGTPDYMAPEQGRGDPLDGRADLYAVGVLLFQLVTGELPFQGETATQVVLAHMQEPIPDPRTVGANRELSDAWVQLIFRALAKEAADRFQDAAEFADALDALEVTRSSVEPPLSVPIPVSIRAATVSCPGCNEELPARAKFCLECGIRLRTTAPRRSGMVGLVGRHDDLGWLQDRLAAAGTAPAGARVVGEPGVGKTRLLRALLQRSAEEGFTALRLAPDPWGAEVPYYGLRKVVGELLGGGGNTAAMAARGAPSGAREGLLELLGALPAASRPTADELRRCLALGLHWALGERAKAEGWSGVVLSTDDLHRLDATSQALIADLLSGPGIGCRLLVVGSHVPGFEAGWSAQHPARVLQGLSPEAARTVMTSLGADPAAGEALASDARGALPLHLEHLARFLKEAGGDPPNRLADLITERLDMLGLDARRASQALAVLGDDQGTESIARLLPAGTAAERTLESLQASGLVVRESGRFSVAHPLVREVVLGSLPAGVRRELNARALNVAEEAGAPLEVCALHAYLAEDPFRSLLLLEQVAAHAEARGDAEAEVRALQRALETARVELGRGELDDPLKAMSIFGRKLGQALIRAGALSDAEGVLLEALDLCEPTDPNRAKVLATLAEVAWTRARFDDARTLLTRAMDAASSTGAHELRASMEQTRAAWAS